MRLLIDIGRMDMHKLSVEVALRLKKIKIMAHVLILKVLASRNGSTCPKLWITWSTIASQVTSNRRTNKEGIKLESSHGLYLYNSVLSKVFSMQGNPFCWPIHLFPHFLRPCSLIYHIASALLDSSWLDLFLILSSFIHHKSLYRVFIKYCVSSLKCCDFS